MNLILSLILDSLPTISDIGNEFWSQYGHNSVKQDCSMLSQHWCSESNTLAQNTFQDSLAAGDGFFFGVIV